MSSKTDLKQLYTPPMTNRKFDLSQSIKESYKTQQIPLQEDLQDVGSNGWSTNVELTREEIDQEVNGINELPPDLSKLIDAFINDLKQPKYVKPLSILQLSSLFQNFYTKFDRSSFNYVVNTSNNGQPTFLAAKETLSSGLSGIFARSRSSSGSSFKRDRRSSSLLSTDSNNATPMLSPEEINRQLRLNEINNLKVERFMELCERDVFQRLSKVGTSVPSPSRDDKGKKVTESDTLKVANLFRNSPEYGEYDKLLFEKMQLLSKLAADGRIDLAKFLDLPDNVDLNRFGEIQNVLLNLVYQSMGPGEKVETLLKVHQSMMYSHVMSNDEFLSLIIFYAIKVCPKNIFLNAQFIRLFRYKKKLVQKELFALTNLEAALVFIEGLTLSDFPSELLEQLSLNEKKLLESAISRKISLPNKPNISQNVDNCSSDMQHPEVLRSNSYDGFRSAFDSSLRNIFGKMRSYTPPTSLQPTSLPRSTSQSSFDNDRRHCHAAVPSSMRRFKDRSFEDLKLSEMKEIFEIYQKLVS
ncbi:hypothetical protein HG536_0D01090 [Torulaspora globosa]|uniref:VPS9 domain-containing protein n=1 Tax=Torulaspora globosa TaxID=48254 RepID=A0A7G3ZGF1_9SACH|nr:uncharacterized protein HG536_0D01090 [Torulaspora globosa]QLL32587.1 hypothetical protein HG536_0D01090 [Torulaspora globosa]